MDLVLVVALFAVSVSFLVGFTFGRWWLIPIPIVLGLILVTPREPVNPSEVDIGSILLLVIWLPAAAAVAVGVLVHRLTRSNREKDDVASCRRH